MKRIQLFEFEDQNWFPNNIRIGLTRLIMVLHKMLGLADVLSERIGHALTKSENSTIVDLGSGAGGAMPDVLELVKNKEGFEKTNLILSDLFPNSATAASINDLNDPSLKYETQPVDATQLNNAPSGLKTMINSFHHMNPTNAKRILNSAAENKESLFIYEMAENKIPVVLWWLFLPLSLVIMIIMVIFMTPFVKPLTFHQLFFTYIIPVIPISYAWDGQASMPRIYTLHDIDTLLMDVNSDNYIWEKGPVINKKGKKQGYYVLGTPVK
jgi:hypothetical protein